MYLRKATRRYKGKTYTNYVLVESVRTPKGPRQKTVCTLGDLAPRSRQDWLKLAHKIEDALSAQGNLFEPGKDPAVDHILVKVKARQQRQKKPRKPSAEPLITVDPERVSTERHRQAGAVLVG